MKQNKKPNNGSILKGHKLLCGMTQSGKTFALKNYLANVDKKVFIISTKTRFDWDEVSDQKSIKRFNHISDFSKVANDKKVKKAIYYPVHEELDYPFYNEFYRLCYLWGEKNKGCIVVTDELMQVCKSAISYPVWLKGILTRGMELDITVWNLTQRPFEIPKSVITESLHYFIFRLNSIEDRERIYKYTGCREFYDFPIKYGFWYYNTFTGAKPIQAKLV